MAEARLSSTNLKWLPHSNSTSKSIDMIVPNKVKLMYVCLTKMNYLEKNWDRKIETEDIKLGDKKNVQDQSNLEI